MRVQFAEDIADDSSRFSGFGGRIQSQFVHGVQDAALYRFLSVANIRKCASLDDGDRIIQIGTLGKTGEHQTFLVFVIRRQLIEKRGLFSHGVSFDYGLLYVGFSFVTVFFHPVASRSRFAFSHEHLETFFRFIARKNAERDRQQPTCIGIQGRFP